MYLYVIKLSLVSRLSILARKACKRKNSDFVIASQPWVKVK